MAKGYKQSQWQPVSIEELRAIQHKYPPDTLNKIIKCAEVSDPAKCEQLRRAVSRTAAWLNVDKHFERRPSIWATPEARAVTGRIWGFALRRAPSCAPARLGRLVSPLPNPEALSRTCDAVYARVGRARD